MTKTPSTPIFDEEDEQEQFQGCVDALVKEGFITRESLDEVKDELRTIAEAELKKQGK
jgi:hypothetical protein